MDDFVDNFPKPGDASAQPDDSAIELTDEISDEEYLEFMQTEFKEARAKNDPSYTCSRCPDKETCVWAWDPYNKDGDCIVK